MTKGIVKAKSWNLKNREKFGYRTVLTKICWFEEVFLSQKSVWYCRNKRKRTENTLDANQLMISPKGAQKGTFWPFRGHFWSSWQKFCEKMAEQSSKKMVIICHLGVVFSVFDIFLERRGYWGDWSFRTGEPYQKNIFDFFSKVRKYLFGVPSFLDGVKMM